MEVQRVYNNKNTNFGAGSVTLKKIKLSNIMKYDEIRRIAEEDKLDLFISKGDESKYLTKNDFYTVIAKQDVLRKVSYIGEMKVPTCGTGCLVVSNQAPDNEVAEKLYKTVIKAVETLAENIEKYTGKKPEFLKYLNNNSTV